MYIVDYGLSESKKATGEKSDKVDEDDDDGNDEEGGEGDEADAGLEDLIHLLANEDDDDDTATKTSKETKETSEEAACGDDSDDEKLKPKRTKKAAKDPAKSGKSSSLVVTKKRARKTNTEDGDGAESKPSAATSEITKKIEEHAQMEIITEKSTTLRLVKSTFKSEAELHASLATPSFGRFVKLSDLPRRSAEIKNLEASEAFVWHSVFVLGSKGEPKVSAKGNTYAIWRLHDLGNLESQQEVSLFLFGAAYQAWWKSSEFQVFALCKPSILADWSGGGGGGGYRGGGGRGGYGGGGGNKYYNSAAHTQTKKGFMNVRGGGGGGGGGNWNNFASQKLETAEKISLSINTESQLVALGFALDIGLCQGVNKKAVKKKGGEPGETAATNTKKCKNLVDMSELPYCTFHCTQMDRTSSLAAASAKLRASKYANVNKNTPGAEHIQSFGSGLAATAAAATSASSPRPPPTVTPINRQTAMDPATAAARLAAAARIAAAARSAAASSAAAAESLLLAAETRQPTASQPIGSSQR